MSRVNVLNEARWGETLDRSELVRNVEFDYVSIIINGCQLHRFQTLQRVICNMWLLNNDGYLMSVGLRKWLWSSCVTFIAFAFGANMSSTSGWAVQLFVFCSQFAEKESKWRLRSSIEKKHQRRTCEEEVNFLFPTSNPRSLLQWHSTACHCKLLQFYPWRRELNCSLEFVTIFKPLGTI